MVVVAARVEPLVSIEPEFVIMALAFVVEGLGSTVFKVCVVEDREILEGAATDSQVPMQQ